MPVGNIVLIGHESSAIAVFVWLVYCPENLVKWFPRNEIQDTPRQKWHWRPPYLSKIKSWNRDKKTQWKLIPLACDLAVQDVATVSVFTAWFELWTVLCVGMNITANLSNYHISFRPLTYIWYIQLEMYMNGQWLQIGHMLISNYQRQILLYTHCSITTVILYKHRDWWSYVFVISLLVC